MSPNPSCRLRSGTSTFSTKHGQPSPVKLRPYHGADHQRQHGHQHNDDLQAKHFRHLPRKAFVALQPAPGQDRALDSLDTLVSLDLQVGDRHASALPLGHHHTPDQQSEQQTEYPDEL